MGIDWSTAAHWDAQQGPSFSWGTSAHREQCTTSQCSERCGCTPCVLQCCSSCGEDIKDLLLSAIQITLKYFGESILANSIIEFRGTLLIYYENHYIFFLVKPHNYSYQGSVQDFLRRSTHICCALNLLYVFLCMLAVIWARSLSCISRWFTILL